MKSEPSECSIQDLQKLPQQTIEWFGVRNYQARNFMRDEMQVGDLAIFWHSSCANPGIYGIVRVATKPHADSTQFMPTHKYYEPKASIEKPLWWCVDVQFVRETPYIPIQQLREYPQLEDMQVLKRGNRLSITRVSVAEWDFIQQLI